MLIFQQTFLFACEFVDTFRTFRNQSIWIGLLFSIQMQFSFCFRQIFGKKLK